MWHLYFKVSEGTLTLSVLVSPISREMAALKRKSSVKWDVTWKHQQNNKNKLVSVSNNYTVWGFTFCFGYWTCGYFQVDWLCRIFFEFDFKELWENNDKGPKEEPPSCYHHVNRLKAHSTLPCLAFWEEEPIWEGPQGEGGRSPRLFWGTDQRTASALGAYGKQPEVL